MTTYIARVRRTFLGEPPELVGVVLELIRDEDTVELADGDEFVTVRLEVDPYEAG